MDRASITAFEPTKAGVWLTNRQSAPRRCRKLRRRSQNGCTKGRYGQSLRRVEAPPHLSGAAAYAVVVWVLLQLFISVALIPLFTTPLIYLYFDRLGAGLRAWAPPKGMEPRAP
jgi:hypothetical protein